ncbi:MAG: hypothetical protein WCP07_12615 [bacterium]|jgi:hypothetical protein
MNVANEISPGVTPDAVIEEFLEGEPRAEFWRELRESLQERLSSAVENLGQITPEHPDYKAQETRVAELRQQVRALATEEAVTEFVEDSIRRTLNRPLRFGAVYMDEFDED